jgi:hypothetical protein
MHLRLLDSLRRREKIGIKAALVLFVLLSMLFTYYVYFVPKKAVTHYYSLIAAQESVERGTVITDTEWQQLKECKSITGERFAMKVQDCLKGFYSAYTLNNGVRAAFSHLALVQKEHVEFIADCHYISHGIGHAQLERLNGDVGKAFAAMSEESYFRNVSTCGNGYFHGIIEEFVSGIKDDASIVKKLSLVCTDPDMKNASDCFHGMGHAAYVQLDYQTERALSVCDRASDAAAFNYSCYMGVFMEMAQDIPTRDLVTVKAGLMKFDVCDSLNEKYREACYGQHSVFFERFSATPDDYSKNIRYCGQIESKRYRLACVKFFAGRAVRVAQYADIRRMCDNAPGGRDERLLCVGVFASRISRSLDSSRSSPLYQQAVRDVCRILPPFDSLRCIDTVLNAPETIYFDPASIDEM